MSENLIYAQVILPIPVQASFTYRVPAKLTGKIQIGVRVLVPFGTRKIYSGIVSRISPEKPAFKGIKDIDSVLDSRPLVRDTQIKFWEWISEYYMCTLGEVYRAAFPTGLKLESETRFTLLEGGGTSACMICKRTKRVSGCWVPYSPL